MAAAWSARLANLMTFRKAEIERPAILGGVDQQGTLTLRWRDSRWQRPREAGPKYEAEIARCFAKGWSGLRLSNVSPMEMRAVRAHCSDTAASAIIKAPGFHGGLVNGNLWVSTNEYEVWQADDAATVGLHHLLLSLPARPHVGVTGATIHFLVRPMLAGLNFYAVKSTAASDKDGVSGRRQAISVQDCEGLDSLLSMMGLTR